MAIMIPSVPYNYDISSKEGDIFDALKNLSDDYYVFHSLKIVNVTDRVWHEKEIDFLIYNRTLGLMFIESKAGGVGCEGGNWHYGDGSPMRDPFRQAQDGKWKFKNLLDRRRPGSLRGLGSRCRCVCAVWFPSLDGKAVDSIQLPVYAPREMILTKDDLDNPTQSVERIFSYSVSRKNDVVTRISDADHSFIFKNILCPEFDIIPSKETEKEARKRKFDAMLKEQTALLDYLEYQRSAVINGFAGTGKTMIALEKARRHSTAGDRVLFLCFNKRLKEHLAANYPYENVSYFTIDGFACYFCNTSTADFDLLEEKLAQEADGKAGKFTYNHIIVDEGQDFGQARINADYLFFLFKELAMRTEKGSFYIFYDGLQLIQSEKVPGFIAEADCRLTLYTNCRNTRNIASTSLRPLNLKKDEPVLPEKSLRGRQPEIWFCDDDNAAQVVDGIIAQSLEQGIKNIQILSCSTAGKSIFGGRLEQEKYLYKGMEIGMTTVRKFKGLEAEHIILVDVNKNVLDDGGNLFYVGASRAQVMLSVVAGISRRECRDILEKQGIAIKKKNPGWSLANYLDCRYMN